MAWRGEHAAHRRVAPIEAGERVEEEGEPDEWRKDEKDGEKFLIRIHNTPRFQLFSPSKIKDLPVPLQAIMLGRLTKMFCTVDGERLEDESLWTVKRTATKNMKKEWLGESWFKLNPEEEVKELLELNAGRCH